MLSLLLLFVMAPQSLPPNCGLEVRLIADERVWTPGSDDLVLVEIANPNPFPVVLPPAETLDHSLRFLLRTDRGELTPSLGGTYCSSTPGAWRTMGYLLPPRCAMHFAYGSDALTKSTWRSLPVRGELIVRMDVDAGFVQRLQSSRPSGALVAAGTFEAALDFSVEPTPDLGGRTNPVVAFRQAAKQFLQSVSRRTMDRGRLEGFRAMVADGRMDTHWRTRIQELEGLDLDVSAAEIGEFLERFPSNDLADDLWYSFARERIWDDQPRVREQLLQALLQAWPGSTGAVQAQSWMAWPKSWDLCVVEPTGHPGTPQPNGAPEPHPNPVQEPYLWVSKHGRFRW